MTHQELTGYVRAILDHKRIYDHVDPEKDIQIKRFGQCCQRGWKIEVSYISELKKLSLIDPDGHGIICFEPLPIKNEDWFWWHESEGVSKLHKEVEEMIERINKIEL
jgi:hypothetical protein